MACDRIIDLRLQTPGPRSVGTRRRQSSSCLLYPMAHRRRFRHRSQALFVCHARTLRNLPLFFPGHPLRPFARFCGLLPGFDLPCLFATPLYLRPADPATLSPADGKGFLAAQSIQMDDLCRCYSTGAAPFTHSLPSHVWLGFRLFLGTQTRFDGTYLDLRPLEDLLCLRPGNHRLLGLDS